MKIWKQRQQDKAGPSSYALPSSSFRHSDAMLTSGPYQPSTSYQPKSISKSSSRTSLDLHGHFDNFLRKSTSNADLTSSSGSPNKSPRGRFTRPRTASVSNASSPGAISPNKLLQPRKWVNHLLHSAANGKEQLETAAQARSRASVDLGRPSPAFVSSLVLSSANDDDDHPYTSTPDQSRPRPPYTLEGGLQRDRTRPASVYSSHLSSASRSNPELHRNSMTRHLDNGAMAMNIAPTLSSLAPTSRLDIQPGNSSRLEIRNGGGAEDRCEEEQIDASIARDMATQKLGKAETAVFDMLASVSPVKSQPVHSAAQNPSLTSPSANSSTAYTAAAVQACNASLMSPRISALLRTLSSTDAQNESSAQTSGPASPMSENVARQRASALSPIRTSARVPVPMLTSTGLQAPRNAPNPTSPIDGSQPASSALATSFWSKAPQSPATPSSSQDPYSPLRSAISGPSKWSSGNGYFNLKQGVESTSSRPTYDLHGSSSPISKVDDQGARRPPLTGRHMTDFTVASSVSAASGYHGSAMKETEALKDVQTSAVSASAQPSSHHGSTAGSLSSLIQSFQRAEYNSRPSTPSKIVLPASPTKAKDLIRMFETNSATASPSERHPAEYTPRQSTILSTESVTPHAPSKRNTPLALFVSRSNLETEPSVGHGADSYEADSAPILSQPSNGYACPRLDRSSGVNVFLKTSPPASLLEARRQSAGSENQASMASVTSQGSASAYRRTLEAGNLPLLTTTAVEMTGEVSESNAIRAGALLYYNVHGSDPRWLSVNAVLLPTGIAMSWIPVGGGRENVVLDLHPCREVHSVPSPDHPSTASDVGAISARQQSLGQICPFQLIFDDGIERFAADTVMSRLQWVASFREVLGTPNTAVVSIAETHAGSSGHSLEFSQALSTGGSVPPPLPPKDADGTPTSRNKSKSPDVAIESTSRATGNVRAMIHSWQNPTLTSGSGRLSVRQDGERTVWTQPDSADRTPTGSTDMDGYESALSHNTVSDDFGPRTPASEILFSWDRLDKDSDLNPSDSASQRPARSEYGTIKSTISHEYTPSLDPEPTPHISVQRPNNDVVTPPEAVNDVVSSASPHDPSPLIAAYQSSRLGTVLEETSSQAHSASVYNSLRSNGVVHAAKHGNVATAISKGTSVVSQASDSTFNSEDVTEMLKYLEIQERQRAVRNERLESQARGFQHTMATLQKHETNNKVLRGTRRSSDGSVGTSSKLSFRSTHDSELAAVQDKLDKVLTLMTDVVVGQHANHNRGRSESMLADDSDEDAETARVEAVLARLLRKMQKSEDKARGQRVAEENASLPLVTMSNVAGNSKAAGDQAATEVSVCSRMTPRSWTSENGIPPPPPNSEWESKSSIGGHDYGRLSMQVDAGHRPIQDIRMLGDPSLFAATPRTVLIGSQHSCGSVDMEAEVRKRRAHQKEASGASVPAGQGGGWYTLKGDEERVEESDVGLLVGKAMSPPPNVAAVARNESTNKALARKASIAASGRARYAGLPAGSAGVEDMGSVMQALQRNEAARQVEMRQQTDISRYLNELNAWLEKDVADRSKEWRSLAFGVKQLHEELKALKQGAGLTSSAPARATLTDSAADATLSDTKIDEEAKPETATPMSDNNLSSGSKRGALPPIPTKTVSFADDADAPKAYVEPDRSKWIHNDVVTFGNIRVSKKSEEKAKTDKAKAATFAENAALVRAALNELEKFKVTQRSQGKPESPLPVEAKDDSKAVEALPLPEEMWSNLKNAADKKDHTAIAESVRECATKGYGALAVVKLTEHVESKAVDDEAKAANKDDGVQSMQTPVPRSYKAKEKSSEPARKELEESKVTVMGDSGPTTSTLALAVEEILKHLLERKEEEKEKQAEAEAKEAAREQALLTLKEQEKAELVDMIYTKIQEAKAAEEANRQAKEKEMDPKTAIETLVEAINAQKLNEVKSQQTADVAIRQMTSELLKSTTEQNQKMVEAVNAASRDMLRTNVHSHAEEFKRILHKEVTSMFEDVGKIREAKRHLEFEIADLWSIKSRHLAQNATSGLPISYGVPGEFPSIQTPQQPKAFSQPLPQPQIKRAEAPAPFPPGNIRALPAPSPPKAIAPAASAAPAVQTLGNVPPSKHFFSNNFGPRQPLYR